MNKQDKNSIGWCDYTANPVKGLCPVGCWYCYAKGFHQRFKLNKKLRFDKNEINKIVYLRKPSKIFIGSTIDLFHPKIPLNWIDKIIQPLLYCEQHTYFLLTKHPDKLSKCFWQLPGNWWIGTTVENEENLWRILFLKTYPYCKNKFISFEPLLGDFRLLNLNFDGIDWIIIGAMTGPGSRKYQPKREWIENILKQADKYKVPVFMKDNLKGVWKGRLRREFPNV